jgi:uncharacterized membrane protein YecN with MAPEG domain
VSEEQNPIQEIPPKERLAKAVQVQAPGPQSSYWPFALALALVIALIGVITNLIVIGVGVVLAIAAVIGWGLEKR